MKENTSSFAVKKGEEAEIKLVQEFNKNPNNCRFSSYTSNFESIFPIFLVRITSKQYSNLSGRKTNTRADIYAISSKDSKIEKLLVDNDFLLDESILQKTQIEYQVINKSGISVKMPNSNSYTLLKLTPDSFYALIGNYEYGAGISIFAENKNDLKLNPLVIDGWKTNPVKIKNAFKELRLSENFETESCEECQNLKSIAKIKTKHVIDNNEEVKDKIFKGLGLYKEPYIAWWFYQNDRIEKMEYIPYELTTGSGRHKGEYTIAMKPKQKMES